jgi:putative membrane-bound dehydrogenase-like protein
MRSHCLSIIASLVVGWISVARAQEQFPWSAGAAKVDITPGYPVRLSGFGFRRTESEGVTQKIWAKALALKWKDGPAAVVLAVDNLGIPAYMKDEVARRLKAKANLDPERLAITASHTHTAPMLTRVAPTLFSLPIPPEHQKNIDRYTAELTDHLEQAARAALADMKPARLAHGVGTVTFAKNRRTKTTPVDHDLPLLAVYGQDDKLRAIWVTYACHCVTLSNNKVSGDWSGYAQEIVEENHAGAVALVSIGCGADQNPTSGVTGDKTDIARAQGAEIAAEVRRLLGGFLTPITGELTVKSKNLELPLAELPTKEQWQVKAKQKGAVGYHAEVNLARLERGEKLRDHVDYSVQTWTFGDRLAMVFLPGEVVVDYAVRLKKELDGRRLVLHAYANDAPCYIPSERVLKEGGYEGGSAMVYYDVPVPFRPGLEQKIVGAVRDLVGPKFAAPFDAKKCETMPLSPQQSLATIQVRKGLTVELMVAEPLVTSPVAIDFGPDGKLWVAEMYDYPLGASGNYEPGGRIRLVQRPFVVPPSGGSATAPPKGGTTNMHFDRATVFLDNIPFPTGVTAYKRGVLVCAAPDILYAEDTDGDGKADLVKKLFTGFGTGNYQARVNSLVWSLDGWIYGSCGLFGGTITSHTGQKLQLGDRDFRIKPDEGIIEPATVRTQQGRVRDDWDNWFGCDNSTLLRHYPLGDHYLRRNPHVPHTDVAAYVPDYPDSNRLFPIGKSQLFKLSGQGGRVTAACGLGIYRDDLLGKEFRGNAFVCEPVWMCVHRLVLSPKGSTFSGRRGADEQTSEFLAATDPWFRPVQAVTGPDGALWIVDMYRYVIEHPRWIPPQDLAKHDLRAGSTMGRIYRVLPEPSSRGMNEVNPAALATPQLVAALNSPNGWQRDQASQLLLARKDAVAAPLLERTLTQGNPFARVHALCVLDGLGKLRPAHVEIGLKDSHPGVQRHAVRLAQKFINEERSLATSLAALAHADDPQTRLQLAGTLGGWRDATAGKLLARLMLGSSDRFLTAAATSSLHPDNLSPFLEEALATASPTSDLWTRLSGPIAALGNGAQANRLLNVLLPEEKKDATAAQLSGLSVFLDVLSRRGTGLDPLLEPAMQQRLQRTLDGARELALDDDASEPQRQAAIQLLGRQPDRAKRDLKALQSLLAPQTPTTLQSAALQTLGRYVDAGAADPLIAAWRSLSPAVKSQALEVLLSRPAWQTRLLEAIRAKKIAVSDVDTSRRQRLVNSKNAKVAALATDVFAGAVSADRQQVIERYAAALTTAGDAARGRDVFRKHCAACHRHQDEGHQVGPDMSVIVGKPRPYLLIEILDPSRNLDSRYVEYLATTSAGRTFTGLLAAETSTSITLRGQEGKQHVLLRAELEALASTGRSLMPEGLEKEIPPEAMADLLAFLTAAEAGKALPP